MLEDLKSGIYCIENKITGNKYIGQSLNVVKRMTAQHNNCKALLDAFDKYEADSFSFYIVEYCKSENLDEKEKFYIKKMGSHVSEGGYNLSWGGSVPMRGMTFSDEHKKKIGDSNRGKIRSEESKIKIGLAKKGFRHSDETKKRIGDSETGEKHHSWGKKKEGAFSKYKGISWHNLTGTWQIRATVDKKVVRIGQDKDEINAAKIYDEWIIANNLPNPLNFPEDYN